jgi:hypothetical protein
MQFASKNANLCVSGHKKARSVAFTARRIAVFLRSLARPGGLPGVFLFFVSAGAWLA